MTLNRVRADDATADRDSLCECGCVTRVPRYASDLTDEDWAVLAPALPVMLCRTELGGRPETLFLVRTANAAQALTAAGDILACSAVGALLLEISGMPAALRGQVHVPLLGLDLGAYRLFLIALVIALAAGLHALVARTRFGAHSLARFLERLCTAPFEAE